jgi:hypothetical protein
METSVQSVSRSVLLLHLYHTITIIRNTGPVPQHSPRYFAACEAAGELPPWRSPAASGIPIIPNGMRLNFVIPEKAVTAHSLAVFTVISIFHNEFFSSAKIC